MIRAAATPKASWDISIVDSLTKGAFGGRSRQFSGSSGFSQLLIADEVTTLSGRIRGLFFVSSLCFVGF